MQHVGTAHESTGDKNQIALLIINLFFFFLEITSLPLPDPLNRWSGLPVQFCLKDTSVYLRIQRTADPARQQQPREVKAQVWDADFKHKTS